MQEQTDYIVTATVSFCEVYSSRTPIPAVVQLRHFLNKKGFRFEDDGKFSSCANLEPKPLGIFKWRYDEESGLVHYKQIIPHIAEGTTIL